MSLSLFPRTPELPLKLGELLLDAALIMAKSSGKTFQIGHRRKRRGLTLQPGNETVLWNELRAQMRPYLLNYGEQANLARVLGLPRQRINDYVTGGGRMPDAERTLQILAWLTAARHRRRPL